MMIPTARRLVDIAFRVNGALASGKCESLTLDHVYAAARREHLVESLQGWLGSDAEPLSSLQGPERAAIDDAFGRIVNVVTPEDFGIDRSSPHAGLAFVMGMILEAIKGAVPMPNDATSGGSQSKH
jgi:hypothetical protein